MKNSRRRAFSTPAQQAARTRNFDIFRLEGILTTLGNITVPSGGGDLEAASRHVRAALDKLRGS
jgi:hypothetical protein